VRLTLPIACAVVCILPPITLIAEARRAISLRATGAAKMTFKMRVPEPTAAAPEVHFDWCAPVRLPPYRAPAGWQSTGKPLRAQFYRRSGACSTLVGYLDVSMYAQAHGLAFFIDESPSLIRQNRTSWFHRYFQPSRAGLARIPKEFVDGAHKGFVVNWVRRDPITMGNRTLERIDMRRHWLRKVWAFQPWVQQKMCPHLKSLKLTWPYIAILVRRGDKTSERGDGNNKQLMPIPLEHWVNALQGFSLAGLVREVFLATDDCRVLDELRAAMPGWRFSSLCGFHFGTGWRLFKDVRRQDLEPHHLKFFGELIAMASATIFLGDIRTNVHNWVVYMRPVNSSNASNFNMRAYPWHRVSDVD